MTFRKSIWNLSALGLALLISLFVATVVGRFAGQ